MLTENSRFTEKALGGRRPRYGLELANVGAPSARRISSEAGSGWRCLRRGALERERRVSINKGGEAPAGVVGVPKVERL